MGELTRPDGLHYSDLVRIAQSPAHYRAGLLAPARPTPAMTMGSLVHALVLGGDVAVFDGGRRGRAWADHLAEHEGRALCVTTREMAVAVAIAHAVTSDPVAAPLLEGERERAWSAVLFGRRCAGRIDVAGPGRVVELKTTRDASPVAFARAALRACYHAQLAWYQAALRALGERVGDDAYVIAVETRAPYAVTVHRLTPRALDAGRRMLSLWTERLAACEAVEAWPAYVQSVQELDVPDESPITIGGMTIDQTDGGDDDDDVF